MKTHPEIKWLIDRWNLPDNEAAISQLEKLLESERGEGGTATKIEEAVESWGNALSTALDDGSSPLIIVEGEAGDSFLQSRRCFNAERSIAEQLKDLSGKVIRWRFPRKGFERFFPMLSEMTGR